ncbi:MAG: DUF4046 domain-containing protein [Calditrichaceae bacterium]|nr:DUF4046 domain-containing protein [Calditrichaceae bacterium]
MQLSRKEISQNYFEALKLALKLIHQTRRENGYSADLSPDLLTELAQSAAGSESIVNLIQSKAFNPDAYQPFLLEAIDQVKKQLFPDVKKHRFISLSQTDMEISIEDVQEINQPSGFHFDNSAALILHHLKSNLNGIDFEYINHLLLTKSINLSVLLRALNINDEFDHTPDYKLIIQKIKMLRKFYPSGQIFDSSLIDASQKLDKITIINIYKNVYLGIDRAFPLSFLKKNDSSRAAILTRFLIEEILEKNPKDVLEKEDETFFIRHKLQNVYRMFNYSANRVLANAYPELIHPWLSSKTPENYWEDPSNRIQAIQWLVEDRMKISPDKLYANSLSRKYFAGNGLSYMFNRYYNSVSKALNDAYPHLHLWEIGPVSLQYWHDKNAIKAIHWLVQKNNWKITDLPKLVSDKKLTRKTFSQFGLATLFEKKFNKNIYQAINLAYPGQFEPWEFGKVSSSYWSDYKNLHRASYWIAKREGVETQKIPAALRSGKLTLQSLKKYSVGAALKRISQGSLEHLFAPILWKEHAHYLDEQRIMTKLQSMIRKEKHRKHLGFYLLYGFFAPNVHLISDAYVDHYERMIRRIKRRRDYIKSI